MTIYRPKDTNFYWVNLTNPITNKRIRKSTNKTSRKDALIYEAGLLAKLINNKDDTIYNAKTKTFNDLIDIWLKEKCHKKSIKGDINKLKILATIIYAKQGIKRVKLAK